MIQKDTDLLYFKIAPFFAFATYGRPLMQSMCENIVNFTASFNTRKKSCVVSEVRTVDLCILSAMFFTTISDIEYNYHPRTKKRLA